MAYTAVNYTEFDPLKELVPLIASYNKEYDAIQDKIDTTSGDLFSLVLPEESKYNTVLNKYKEDLKSASDDFSKGMNSQNAAILRSLFSRGKTEITPIRQAVDAYNKYIEERNAAGPDIIYDKKYTLDDFYGGLKPEYQRQSEKGITTTSTAYFKGLGNFINNGNPEFSKIKEAVGYLLQKNPGLDPGEALTAALSDYSNTETSNVIQQHMMRLAESLGIENYDSEGQKRIWSAIGKGVIGAQQSNTHLVTDKTYRTPEEIQEDLDKKQRKDDAESKWREIPNGLVIPDDHDLNRNNNGGPEGTKRMYWGPKDPAKGVYFDRDGKPHKLIDLSDSSEGLGGLTYDVNTGKLVPKP